MVKLLNGLDADFGKRLREVCRKIGTLEEAAEAGGVTVTSLNRYIYHTSQPALNTVYKIAKAAGISVDYIAEGKSSELIDNQFFFKVLQYINEFVEGKNVKVAEEIKIKLVIAYYNRLLAKAIEQKKEPEVNQENVIDFLEIYLKVAV